MSFASQPPLDFNPRQAARATDPVTSVIAAEKIAPRITKDRLAVLIVHYHHRYTDGIDDFQLAECLGRTTNTSVGKRRLELERMGYIRRGEKRVSPSSLTNSETYSYHITKAGIEYYEREVK